MVKKINKSLILGIMIGGILFGSIGVGATLFYQSEQVSYNNNKNESSNVKDALDSLYVNQKSLQDTLHSFNGVDKLVENATLTLTDAKKYKFIMLFQTISETGCGFNNPTVNVTNGEIYSKVFIGYQAIQHSTYKWGGGLHVLIIPKTDNLTLVASSNLAFGSLYATGFVYYGVY